jgi:hypothetical protein
MQLMSAWPRIFPRRRGVAALLGLILGATLGCGAVGEGRPVETPCQRACADEFLACIEGCGEVGECRDECMAIRGGCQRDCPTPAPDAGLRPES